MVFLAPILGGLTCLMAPLLLAGPAAAAPLQSQLWVGNMSPAGNSQVEIADGSELVVHTQFFRPGATEPVGRGNNVSCTVHWSPVERFGGLWAARRQTTMHYDGDIGNNDEYVARLSLGTGLYEFTTSCHDRTTGQRSWQQQGNGYVKVTPFPEGPSDRRAFWLEEAVLAWNNSQGCIYELHYDRGGDLDVPVKSGSGIPLNLNGPIDGDRYPKFPNADGYDAWHLTQSVLAIVPRMLQGELAIAAYNRSGELVDTTGLQTQGVIDDLFGYRGQLGVSYNGDVPTLRLWAPTARSVTLHRFRGPQANRAIETPMDYDPSTGVWQLTGEPDWDRQYYLYEVEVYVPSTGRIERNFVTDPYAANLSQNSQRSQIVDLYGDPRLKPDGWDALVKPALEAPEDMAVYEAHVRDFSRDDPTVAPEHRGKFVAFGYDGRNGRPGPSNGMRHLQNLSQAGLTHLHLMPAADFSSVNEDPSARTDPNYAQLARFPRDSEQQQAQMAVIRYNDSFNWGYDPYHYGVPEGSYATDANGAARIREFRRMVQVLSQNGLRTVMDVVYNHTFAHKQYPESVLDKIVPGYYYRATDRGERHTSSCCPDTATEFDMMRKLMVDTLVRWAKAYKVDGFRFDLMNLHTVDDVVAARQALQALTPAQDGVDGSDIYLYGEGWDFGSAQAKGLEHANQYNVAGTGIGTFDDKLRDAAHGGSGDTRRQGFINGRSYDWNGHYYPDRFRSDLQDLTDRLRIALAGSLQDHAITDRRDRTVTGLALDGVGYARDPQETVNYVSKHDNETLFDLNAFKLPRGHNDTAVTSMAERVRAQNLGLDLVAFAQGVPFFHLGADMLRSKSLDRNSYDSGDWFNRLNFRYEGNQFGSGLPPAWNNRDRWDIAAPLLADPALDPDSGDVRASVEHLQDVLRIRQSSPLFRLRTAEAIQKRVRFHNTGSRQRDALIAMSISDAPEPDRDPEREAVVVLINAHKFSRRIALPAFAGRSLKLHPVQAQAEGDLVAQARFESEGGTFEIPSRTTAVFVAPQ